jgi:hypothetical protein
MELKDLKNKLKKCQPYFIEKELLPCLYFSEEQYDKEYWTFVYAFLRRLSDTAISIRLGYTSANIHYIIKNILKTNKYIIETFITSQDV